MSILLKLKQNATARNDHSNSNIRYNCPYDGLSAEEIAQLNKYCQIFREQKCVELWQVNTYITKHGRWDEFDKMRSLNNHGYPTRIKGITPNFFGRACVILRMTGDDGNPLIDSEPY